MVLTHPDDVRAAGAWSGLAAVALTAARLDAGGGAQGVVTQLRQIGERGTLSVQPRAVGAGTLQDLVLATCTRGGGGGGGGASRAFSHGLETSD